MFGCFSENKPLVIPGEKKASANNLRMVKCKAGLAAALQRNIRRLLTNEIKTTAHSTYRCQYHIVFVPKYRRKVIYGELKKDIGAILRKLCDEKKVEILEAEACSVHKGLPYFRARSAVLFVPGRSLRPAGGQYNKTGAF